MSTDVSRHVENGWLVVRPVIVIETRSPAPGDRTECGWDTHKETELAVVTAELDGGGEGGGGEEDGGDTDDGGLRGWDGRTE